jgi:hypothetical protein
VAAACGSPADLERASRIADGLVSDGFAEWAGGGLALS